MLRTLNPSLDPIFILLVDFFSPTILSHLCIFSQSSLFLDLSLTPPSLLRTTFLPATIHVSPLSITLTTADHPKYPKQSPKKEKFKTQRRPTLRHCTPCYHCGTNKSGDGASWRHIQGELRKRKEGVRKEEVTEEAIDQFYVGNIGK